MAGLTLLRHGSASWPSGQSGDFGRPLDAQGIAEASQAAAALASGDAPVTLILASSAARTQQTAQIVAAGLELRPDQLILDRRLYLAEAAHLEELLQELAAGAAHVLVVGHNPGLSDLASRLQGRPNSVTLGTGRWWCRPAKP
jgi:phosphohistidine phosphatase